MINGEGKLSFVPYVLFTNYVKTIRVFISMIIGYELFTFIYKARRFPLNITGKGKESHQSKVVSKSELDLGLGRCSPTHLFVD